MLRKLFFTIILIIHGCDLDERPPNSPTDLRGYYSIASGSPQINIKWDESPSDDVMEYHIFRATGLGGLFDSLSTITASHYSFIDTLISWQEFYGYKIRAKDQSRNIGEFSNSIFIESYKPSGNWIIPNYDSIMICIEPTFYTLQSYFELAIGDSLTELGDTLGLMEFSSDENLDSLEWKGNGWMLYSYSYLEMNNDSSGFEIKSITDLPEYFEINLSNPDSGEINFYSDKFKSIGLNHSLKNCNGDSLFP